MPIDLASFAGLLFAFAAVVAGMLLEGGSLKQIVQPTAALIVFGGTLGAVMLQFPLRTLLRAGLQTFRVFFFRNIKTEAAIDQIVKFAYMARKNTLLALDPQLETIRDAFLKRTLMMAVDGIEPADLRTVIRLELENRADMEESIPAVFEAAGGYAPTVGILGAVLGLIQVMQHLDHIDEVGRGIAVAFVATIYGVGLANLVCLPIAGKLKIRQRDTERLHEMMLEGVLGLIEGHTPRTIEARCATFLATTRKPTTRREPRIETIRTAGTEEAA